MGKHFTGDYGNNNNRFSIMCLENLLSLKFEAPEVARLNQRLISNIGRQFATRRQVKCDILKLNSSNLWSASDGILVNV